MDKIKPKAILPQRARSTQNKKNRFLYFFVEKILRALGVLRGKMKFAEGKLEIFLCKNIFPENTRQNDDSGRIRVQTLVNKIENCQPFKSILYKNNNYE